MTTPFLFVPVFSWPTAPGGKLHCYAAGGTTPQGTWSDASGTVPNTNPVTLDTNGTAVVRLTTGLAYHFVLKDSTDTTTLWDADNYQSGDIGLLASLESVASAAVGAGIPFYSAALNYSGGTVGFELNNAAPLRRGRTAPHANFNFFTSLFTVTACMESGKAALAQDIRDVFVAQFGATTGSGVAYVAPWGNDGNAGATWKSAYLTLAQALRLTSGIGTIYLWPGTYAPSDFRYTDTYLHPKKIIAPYSGVTLTYPGDSLSAATWTVNGTSGDLWQTTLSTTSYPIRVLNSGILDKYGLPSPMPLISPFGTTLAVAIAALANATFGWFYDTATKILYVNNHGVNINTDTTYGKSVFSAIYGPNSGDNQLQLLATTTYWENITFDCYMFVLNQSGQSTPQMWARNCTFRYGVGNAVQVQGGIAVTQDCIAYRTSADCANYDTLNSVLPQGIEINFTTRYAGDIGTFGTGSSQPSNPVSTSVNKNGSSAHTGFVVRVNGNHTDAYGPTIGDTTGSYTWNLGVFAGYCQELPGGGTRDGFYTSGTSWYDGCAAVGADFGYFSDVGGVVNIYNSAGTQSASGSGTISAYIPP